MINFFRGPNSASCLAVTLVISSSWFWSVWKRTSYTLNCTPSLERLQGRLQGVTPARMLRELAEALEVLTADRALVLVLEDLQWSDSATVEARVYLGQQPETARLA